MQRVPTSAIPTFGLYGEEARFPDVLHVETIAKRSSLHGWNIRPHRHAGLHQVLLLAAGSALLSLEGEAREIGAPWAVNVPARAVHGYCFAAGCEGWVLTVPVDVVGPSLAACPALRLPAIGAADNRLAVLFAELMGEYGSIARTRAHNLAALAALALGRTAEALAPGSAAVRPVLVARFEALVERHHCDRWTVARYAAALGVTSTHLSRECRGATGLAASRIVEARRMTEARRLLAYTPNTVSVIAAELGFLDPAHFTRAFTRATSVAPTAFRARLSAADRTGPRAR